MHEEEVAVVFFGIVGCVAAIWIVVRYLFLTIKQWQATALVRDMIARGYTAQEIMQVCQVLGQKKFPPFRAIMDVPPAKPIRQPAYS
jgi:hypothetical protein